MTNLEAALKYLDKGWSVFPINPTDKKPIIDWKQYQDKLPTKEEVNEGWSQWPWASIGLVTGKLSGVSVVDVDPRHNGKTDNLEETVKSQTGSGGWHYFYVYSPEVHSQNGLREGIDLKSDGGYVILPPSEHKSGNKYKWITPPFVNEFKQLPQWIIDNQNIKRVSTFDPALLQGVSEGQRNESAASVIGKILHGLKEEDWQTIGWQALTGWNLKNKPPLEETELLTVFNSIASREAIKDPRQNSTLYGVGSDMSQVIPSGEANNVLYTPLPLSDLSKNDEPIDWIWDGYVAKGHQTLLSALWKAGKTVLIAHLLKALQNDGSLAGQNTHKCKVLILSEESGRMWARRRDEDGITLPVWILPRPIRQKLFYREWVSLLEQMAQFCEQNEIELFIIDTLSAFWSVDNENDAARVSAALLPINHLLEKDIAVLSVHHFRKSGGDEGTASRGSGQIGAAVDIMIEFSRLNSSDPNSTQRVLRTYSRFDETQKEIVINYVDGEYQTVGTKAEVSKLEKLDIVLTALEDYQEGVTASELYDKWNIDEFGKRPSKRTLQRHLSDLVGFKKATTIGTTTIKGGEAPIYIKLLDKDPRQQPTTESNTSSLNQPQNPRQDTETDILSQVEKKEVYDPPPY